MEDRMAQDDGHDEVEQGRDEVEQGNRAEELSWFTNQTDLEKAGGIAGRALLKVVDNSTPHEPVLYAVAAKIHTHSKLNVSPEVEDAATGLHWALITGEEKEVEAAYLTIQRLRGEGKMGFHDGMVAHSAMRVFSPLVGRRRKRHRQPRARPTEGITKELVFEECNKRIFTLECEEIFTEDNCAVYTRQQLVDGDTNSMDAKQLELYHAAEEHTRGKNGSSPHGITALESGLQQLNEPRSTYTHAFIVRAGGGVAVCALGARVRSNKNSPADSPIAFHRGFSNTITLACFGGKVNRRRSRPSPNSSSANTRRRLNVEGSGEPDGAQSSSSSPIPAASAPLPVVEVSVVDNGAGESPAPTEGSAVPFRTGRPRRSARRGRR